MERNIHILVIPYSLQGHINPMLQFSKRLASKGPRVTFISTSRISKSIQAHESSSINFETISDGSEEVQDLEIIDEKVKRFNSQVSQNLPKLIEKHNSSKYPPKFLAYDSILPWALNVARQSGLDGAPFFTQSCVVNNIYYHAHQGTLQMPLEEASSTSLPSMPSLGINDMPSIFCDMESYPGELNIVVSQFSNFQEANWLLCHTFDELEDESIQAHESSSINFETISDGSEEVQDLETSDEKLKRFKSKVSQNLPKFIEKHNSSKYPPKFLVYDSVLPWALNVARQSGLDGAPFFTQSCVVNAIYYHAHQGTLQMPLEEGSSISLPSMPSLGINDMPTFLYDTGSTQMCKPCGESILKFPGSELALVQHF
ncbi:udp-glycosyltransferase 74e2 [Quercus suber]|uniref:Udp-glycosyltransferase 74e2 n=1 Tax=Quercus suber TaxID=58331 RepID=A0AAW0IKZ8_QUESU